MLKKLHIRNFAIIDEITIDFSNNLNIITGETGAGKSILMGALNLILGERADSSLQFDKALKIVVEGCFAVENLSVVKQFLIANELDADDELLVRREIAVNGKSRAFVNDTPVNLVQLKQLSSMLVDLHQQFDTAELGDNNFQREVLDALAGNSGLLNDFNKSYSKFLTVKKELEDLKLQQSQAQTAADYNKFLFDELEEADIAENELENLDVELKLLSNAEEVKQQLSNLYFEMAECDLPLVQQIKTITGKLHQLEKFHPDAAALALRVQSAQLELADIAESINHINQSIQYNPERLQLVNEKISTGYKLLKKHQVNSSAQLIEIKNSLQIKLADIFNIAEIISEKEKDEQALFKTCKELASSISINRKAAIKPFTEKVNELLVKVGMPNARIQVNMETTSLNLYGCDTINILFDANKNNRFEALNKVASGGELSRLMLCIKYLVAKKLQLPILIFDEIDTGISGEAAKQVGNIMKELSTSHQVIAITHQPQIAAKADAHYFVYKTSIDKKVVSAMRLLKNNERVEVIAQMLGGEKPSKTTLENAREMLEN